MFLSYDLKNMKQRAAQDGDKDQVAADEVKIERFFNKDQNFSIAWYPDLKALQQATLQTHLEQLE